MDIREIYSENRQIKSEEYTEKVNMNGNAQKWF